MKKSPCQAKGEKGKSMALKSANETLRNRVILFVKNVIQVIYLSVYYSRV